MAVHRDMHNKTWKKSSREKKRRRRCTRPQMEKRAKKEHAVREIQAEKAKVFKAEVKKGFNPIEWLFDRFFSKPEEKEEQEPQQEQAQEK